MVIFDIGAFRGALSLFFAAQAGPEGQVFAFEPHPHGYARILAHLDLNAVSNVRVRNVAVGAETGTLQLVGSSSGDGRTSANEDVQRGLDWQGSSSPLREFTVDVVSIDDEVRAGGLPPPDFVKIDVEGLELHVLEGMRETIAQSKPQLYIEMHGAGMEAKRLNAQAVVELLIGDGYDLLHVESGRLVSLGTSVIASEGHLYCEAATSTGN